MKYTIYTAFLILLLAACKPGIPGDIVQPAKMALILHDIHVVDGYITTISNPDSAKRVAGAYYEGIYKKYEIDSALYARSMDYYYQNPKAMDAIYNDITKKLTDEKADIVKTDSIRSAKESKKLKLKMKADSIKAVKLRNHPDSIKKRKADSVKQLVVAKEQKLKMHADSVKRIKAMKKFRLKMRADSIKKVNADKKLTIKKKTVLFKKPDSLNKTKKIN